MLWKRGLSFLAAMYLLLGSWRGYVALFEYGSEEPCQIFPCPVDTLPEKDRETLEARIPIRNPKALQQALEDYLS